MILKVPSNRKHSMILCCLEENSQFPGPAGHPSSHAGQDAIGLLGHLGTPLAHVQPVVDQHPQVLFCWAAFQTLFPKPTPVLGVVMTQGQDPTLTILECHVIELSPSI